MTTTEKLPSSIPTGRVMDLMGRSDAALIAFTYQGSLGETLVLRRFNSRAALEAFCKPGSKMHALVKVTVAGPMLVNRNTQRAL